MTCSTHFIEKSGTKLEGGGGGGEISGNLLNPTEPIPLLCVLRPMFTNKTFATGFGFVFMLFFFFETNSARALLAQQVKNIMKT